MTCNMNIDNLLAHLNFKKTGDDKWQCICPSHDDKKAGLSITKEGNTILMKCQAGCETENVLAAIGLEMKDLFIDQNNNGKSSIVEEYDYVDPDGKLIFQTIRNANKKFLQRRPDNQGDWFWNLKDITPLPYRLPNIIEAVKTGNKIFIVEGEKDVHSLEKLGLTATTNPMGAGNWKNQYDPYFNGANVIIIPDNDDPGKKHAIQVASSIFEITASLKILELPGLPLKGDVTDWINSGGTSEDLIELVNKCKPFQPMDIKKKVKSVISLSGSDKFSPSDTWNADFLASNFGDQIRYNHTSDIWHIWDSTRWQPDESKQIYQIAKKNVKEILKFAGKLAQIDGDNPNKERKKAFDWALKSEQRKGILNALEMAKSLPKIKVVQRDFDKNPFLFNCKNGTYDLEFGRFNDHDRSDHLTKRCEVDYDSKAEAPYWYESLNLIFDGDEELIRFIQQSVGYTLTGLVDEEVLFFCYGRGKNGKSRFFDVLEMLFGDYFLKTHADLFTTVKGKSKSEYYVAGLPGARLVVASELYNGQMFNESLIKDLTGGDPLNARFPFGRPFQFYPTHKLWMYGNSEPRVRATDEGFWRRILKIPFSIEIPDDKRKPKSELNAIFKEELPGILNWAITGFQDYAECKKLIIPATVRSATNEYREESDIVGIYINECCKKETGIETPVKTVYQKYVQWCDDNNERPLKKISFNKMLQDNGFEKPFKGTNNVSTWKDLKIIGKS